MTPAPESNDIFWQAFQYVSGEGSPAEREAFEERLSQEMAACEALAEAVRLYEALQATRSLSSHPLAARSGAIVPTRSHREVVWARPSQRTSRLRSVVAVVATAAVIALLVGWKQIPTTERVDPEVSDSRSMLNVWTSLGTSESVAGEIAWHDSGREDMGTDGRPVVRGDDVPSWMFEALLSSAVRPNGSPGEAFDDEETL